MTDTPRPISADAQLTAPAVNDFLPIVDVSEPLLANRNKRISIAELFTGVPDGSATAPGLAFNSAPGTGFHFNSGTGLVGLSISGVQRASFTPNVLNWGPTTGDCGIAIGPGATANRAAYVDLVGDTTYIDYGLRLIRSNAGPNASSQLNHRGTGGLFLTAVEAAPIVFQTSVLERARIDSAGRLLVGTSSAVASTSGLTPVLQVQATTAAASIGVTRWSADNQPAYLALTKSRGAAVGTRGLPLNGDGIGAIAFTADDGTVFGQAARISVIAGDDCAIGSTPGTLVITTTPSGSVTPVERMRIKSTGTINFSNVATYADNTAATAGGLAVGDVYRTATGQLMIRY